MTLEGILRELDTECRIWLTRRGLESEQIDGNLGSAIQ